jgi:hypothetical protein
VKKFNFKGVATNRWTFEKRHVEGTIRADSKEWARLGAKEMLDLDGHNLDQVEVSEAN